jgi:hypothetical protein
MARARTSKPRRAAAAKRAQPAARKPSAQPPAAKPPAAKRSAAKPSAVKPPAATRSAARPSAAKPVPKKPAAAKPPAAKQPAAKPSAAKQPAAKPSAAKQPAAKPSAVKPPAAKPPAAKSPAAKPSAAKPVAKKPVVAKPSEKTAAATRAATPVSSRPARPRVVDLDAPPLARPARLSGGSSVVKVLDSKQPVEALRKFLAKIDGEATREEGQIALGSAQLMLLPIAHEDRGGDAVKQLLDLVLARWDAFPDRAGFHAQEFLRNAFAAVGNDPARIAQLARLVPRDATSELRFNMAGAYAIAGDHPAMLRALEAALSAGATAAQVRRDPDLAPFVDDPAVTALLDRAAVPIIPVDVAPHVAPVRAALDTLVGTLRGLGEAIRFNPPASLDAILAIERAHKLQLPNDYRALLTITDGLAMWDHEFFGVRDYRGETSLAARARAFLEMSVSYGGIGMDECVPLANWGQPNNWLLYDPRGAVREGSPGYVVMLTADPWPLASLADALTKLEADIRDILATN